jgi:hypothetical protein
MNASRAVSLACAALLLGVRAVRADDQTTIISAHGDALANSASAQALVKPMPTLPPNSAPPKLPDETAASPANAPAAPTAVVKPAGADMSPAAYSAGSSPSQPAAVAAVAPPPAAPSPQPAGHAKLVIVGALAALALFLWERRSKS